MTATAVPKFIAAYFPILCRWNLGTVVAVTVLNVSTDFFQYIPKAGEAYVGAFRVMDVRLSICTQPRNGKSHCNAVVAGSKDIRTVQTPAS